MALLQCSALYKANWCVALTTGFTAGRATIGRVHENGQHILEPME